MMAIWKMSNVREILAYICQISSQWNSTWLNMSNKLTRLIWKWHFRWKDIRSCIWRSDPCADQELKLSSTPNCPLDSDALLLADLAWFQAKLLRSVKANIFGKWLVLKLPWSSHPLIWGSVLEQWFARTEPLSHCEGWSLVRVWRESIWT